MIDEKMTEFFQILIKQTENNLLRWERKRSNIKEEPSFHSSSIKSNEKVAISFKNEAKTQYLIQIVPNIFNSNIESTVIDVNSKVGEIVNVLWNLLDNKYPQNNSLSFEKLIDEYINVHRSDD